jgi:hypothetical protein
MRLTAYISCCAFAGIICLNAAQALRKTIEDNSHGVLNRGPHSQQIQYTIVQEDEQGVQTLSTNSYIQLQSGLNRWDQEKGEYVPADARIEVVNGSALVRNAQHRAIFSEQLTDPNGTIDLETTEGGRLITQPVGIALTDIRNGNSVFLAEIKESKGILVDDFTFVYPDAFDQFRASIMVRSHLYGIQSDVVLEERIDRNLLAEFGVDPGNARIEVWHLVLGNPNAKASSSAIQRLDGIPDDDHTINLPGMAIVRGSAYALQHQQRDGSVNSHWVAKQWLNIDNAQFLIESIPFSEAEDTLKDLPPGDQARRRDTKRIKELFAKRDSGKDKRSKPVSIAAISEPAKSKYVSLAAATAALAPSSGYVIDYTTYASSLTNHTFRGDSTYWITGDVGLFGTTTLEGGAVIKFTNYTLLNPVLRVYGDFKCNTSPYNVAILTAEDDDTVGEKIASSTGVPETSTFYAWFNIWFLSTSTNPISVHDIHSRYGHVGFGFERPVVDNLYNVQVFNCDRGIEPRAKNLNVRNALVYKTRYAFNLAQWTNIHIFAEHVTVDTARELVYSPTNWSNSVELRNSLISGITNDTDHSKIYSNSFDVAQSAFTTSGRGKHYLADDYYRNVGITNISLETASILRKTTTYPPVTLSNDFTSNTVLYPIVERDTDTPDLGYHYNPLDFLVGERNVTNSTLVLTNGVSIGVYGTNGFVLQNGASLYSTGKPELLNTIVRYQSVQEDPSSILGSPRTATMSLIRVSAGSSDPVVKCRFTRANFLSDGFTARFVVRGFLDSELVSDYTLQDCQFVNSYHRHLVQVNPGTNGVQFLNNFFQWSAIVFYQTNTSGWYEFPLTFRNNTVRDCATTFYHGTAGSVWTAKDNYFCRTPNGGSVLGFDISNNSYYSSAPGLGGSNNVTLTTAPDYTTGPLGEFYYPSSGSTLFSLVNAGARAADWAGLYHYTTQAAANSKETNSIVDIGFHYVSADSGGNPTDSDSDGLADYFEDSNGNGVVDTGETDPDDPDSDGDGVIDGTEWLQGRNPLVGAVSDTNGIINLRVYTPLE